MQRLLIIVGVIFLFIGIVWPFIQKLVLGDYVARLKLSKIFFSVLID